MISLHYAEVPPRVEYSLTEIVRGLSPILDAMHKWGAKYRMLNGRKGTGKKGSVIPVNPRARWRDHVRGKA